MRFFIIFFFFSLYHMFAFNLYQTYNCSVIEISLHDKNSTINILNDTNLFNDIDNHYYKSRINILLYKKYIKIKWDKVYTIDYIGKFKGLSFYKSKNFNLVSDNKNDFLAVHSILDNIIYYYICK